MKGLLAKIEMECRESQFSGVISISQNEDIMLQRAYGFRNRSEGLVNNTETAFGIASGTKLFTALAVAKLIEWGELSFDSKVGDIDDSYRGFIDPKATILDLLSHRSGIYDYFDEELISDWENYHLSIPWYRLETPSDYLPLFRDMPAKFSPGERYSYSNGGYIFLGIILEKISKRLFRDFVREHILLAAEMESAGFWSFDDLPKNCALAYRNSGSNRTNIYNLPIRGASDGGMYSNAGNLRKFWHALFRGTIIPEHLLNEMLLPSVHFSDVSGYSRGLYWSKHPTGYTRFIVGEDMGVGFDSRYLPEKNIVVSILSNESGGEERLRELIFPEIYRCL